MKRLLLLTAVVFVFTWMRSGAEDWPTYQHDFQRSGVTTEKLDLPLEQAWVYTAKNPPAPSWPPPARADFWHRKRDLNPRVIFDRAFQVAVAGGSVFFGSSADDKVYCLDAETGSEKWAYFTGGPVRLAPSVAEGRLYYGSDDGALYCLDAARGSLLWKRSLSKTGRCVIGNGRMISMAPARTGAVVIDRIVYCCAGLFPEQEACIAAFNARTGKLLWSNPLTISPQGYMLASDDRLYVPTGRTSPVVFDRKTGNKLGAFEGSAGSYALVTDEHVVYGPGDAGSLGLSSAESRDKVATFSGLHMIVQSGVSYLHAKTRLSAIDRIRYIDLANRRNALSAKAEKIEEELKNMKEATSAMAAKLRAELDAVKKGNAECVAALPGCTMWEQPCSHPYSLILAKDVLFAGGDESVAAYSAKHGKLLWEAPVPGRVYGLAAANGRLYASTDKGTVHCFR